MTATDSPFHPGEQAVQARMGVREAIEPWARKVIRSYMPDQHREFYAQLPFAVAAARDDRGRPWVTLLTGEPGFITSPDATTLVLDTAVLPGDALESSFGVGAEIGLLGIELDTRRRNRVNGEVIESTAGQLRFEVGQAFGNCPQYITERVWYAADVDGDAANSSRHSSLDATMQNWIQRADTFFIGSGHRGDDPSASDGMDASHRGGPAGFVRVVSPTRIVFPDYAGNNHFNTIGNLLLDPRVAMTFVDFENGGLLQLTGRATIDWDSPAVAEHPGAQRLVVIGIDEVVQLEEVLPIRFLEPKGLVRELRLTDRRRESDDVVSFLFASRDGGELPDFEAGQHLPLEFRISGMDQPVTRTYSLSNGPGEGRYRISVKREPQGLISRLLHDQVEPGAVINARIPAGDFIIGHHGRPIVLLSAGIGVTPMVSMLHAITSEQTNRAVYFLHSARDGKHHPLAAEVAGIVAQHSNVVSRIAYTQPLDDDRPGRDYDVSGRIDTDFIRQTVIDTDAEYYICGPATFLTAMSDSLFELGVGEDRIHIEQF
ncbi:MAG: pyridoxamine 5'-phosphate oxidase family protein [Woeseiaceae bacterium]|nr:pyridoxamine 5'-phosphate oxidase family protein [Woeseiaceae bacterium]